MAINLAESMGFAVFQWVSEEYLASVTSDELRDFFARDFADYVRSKGGTDPLMASYTQASPEDLAQLGIEPRADARLFRVYGHAIPPAGTVPIEADIV